MARYAPSNYRLTRLGVGRRPRGVLIRPAAGLAAMSRPPCARSRLSDPQSVAGPRARQLLQIGLTVLCLGTARDVAASEVIVEWTAPPECPDQADMVDFVERALGDATNANLTATANVTRSAGVFRAVLHITSSAGYGQRILENARCELLAESVALVIALSTPHTQFHGASLRASVRTAGSRPRCRLMRPQSSGRCPNSHSAWEEPWRSRASLLCGSSCAAPTTPIKRPGSTR